MKKLLYILLFSSSSLFSQNLVPNPSFEQYDTCPYTYSKLKYSIPWFQPTTGTPDYFNACINGDSVWGNDLGVPANILGYQTAKTGTAYAGEGLTTYYLEYKEYIEVKLSSPLQVGTKYFVSFYVSLADSAFYATDDIGACFSVDSLKQDTFINIPVVPLIANLSGNFLTDKTFWTAISGSFIADSAYQYITIGNFKNDTNTDSLFIGGGGASVWGGWLYTIYYYIDDVCVSDDSLTCMAGVGVNDLNFENNNLFVYPTPTNGIFFIESNEFFFRNAKIGIYDVVGNRLFETELHNKINTINIENLSEGIYFLKINFDNKEVIKKIILTKP